MAETNIVECEVKYLPDQIILTGDTQAIHLEADKIIKRFAHSTKPFRVVADAGHEIVLGTNAEQA
jgi:hypothetical protein